jgi:hypothetical protein
VPNSSRLGLPASGAVPAGGPAASGKPISPFTLRGKAPQGAWQSELSDLVDRVVIIPVPLFDGDGKDVRQCSKIVVDRCVAASGVAWRRVAPEHVAVLGNERRGDVCHDTVPQSGFPPQELLGLLPDSRCPLVGKNIDYVAVNQVSQRVPLRLSSLKMATF